VTASTVMRERIVILKNLYHLKSVKQAIPVNVKLTRWLVKHTG